MPGIFMGYGWNRNKFAEAKKLDKNKVETTSPILDKTASPRRRSNAFKNFQIYSNSTNNATNNRDDLAAWGDVQQVTGISNRLKARVESVQNVTGRLDRKLEKVEAAGEKFRKKFMKARIKLEEQENAENLRAMSLWSKKKVKKIGSLDDKIKNKTSKLSVVERMCAESRNKTEALAEFSKVESGKVDFEKVESNTVESDKIELEKLESIKMTKKMSETNQNKINEHGSEGKVLPGTNHTVLDESHTLDEKPIICEGVQSKDVFEVEKQAATVAEIEGVEHQLQNQPETLHVEPEKVPEEIIPCYDPKTAPDPASWKRCFKVGGGLQVECAVWCLAADEHKIVAGCEDGMVRFYDRKSYEQVGELNTDDAVDEEDKENSTDTYAPDLQLANRSMGDLDINDVVWSLDYNDRILISGTRERSLKIWDMKSGKHLRTFSEHYSSVMAVKLRRTEKWGDLVLTGSADETSLLAKIVYDCPTSRNGFDLKKIGLLEGHRGPVRSVDFLNDNTIVTAGLDRRIIIWKINPDSQHLPFFYHQEFKLDGGVNAVTGNYPYVFTASNDTTVRVFNIETKKKIVLKGHQTYAYAIGFHNNVIVSGDGSGCLKLWNLAAVTADKQERKTRSAEKVLMRTHKNVAKQIGKRCMSQTIRGIVVNDRDIIVGDANGRIIMYKWDDTDDKENEQL